MKRSISAVIIGLSAMVLLLAPFSATAQEDAFSERKGFVLGFDAGAGYEYYSLTGGKGLSLGAGTIKIGWGLSEKFLLLTEMGYSTGLQDSTPSMLLMYLAPQIFATNSLYVRPELGFAFGKVEKTSGTAKEDGYGLSAGMASGYEFRLTKRFTLSPEVQFRYARIEGGNAYITGVFADLRWYF